MTVQKKNLKVREIMQTDVTTLFPDQTAFDASVFMASEDVGTVPIVKEDSTLIGIITDRDIVIRCNAVGKDVRKTKIYECMTSNPIRVVPSTSTFDAVLLMSEYAIRRLPVVENDKLVGIISMSDIAKHTEPPTEKCINDGTYHLCAFVQLAKELQRTSHSKQACCGYDI